MKIGICGGGPLGIEMAFCVHQLGGAFRLFSSGPLGGNIRRAYEHFPQRSLGESWQEVTSDRGRQWLAERKWSDPQFLQKIPTVGEYWEQYLSRLMVHPAFGHYVEEAEVVRVQKRFLGVEEEIPQSGRFLDLFRVIFVHHPAGDIEEQLKDNPDLLRSQGPLKVLESMGLGQEQIIASLKTPMEAYEDFDMVVMSTGVFQNPRPMGAGSTYAVGELHWRPSPRIHYLHPALKLEALWRESLPKEQGTVKSVCLVGSGLTAALALLQLKDWLFASQSNTLTLITEETQPFGKLYKLKNRYRPVLNELDQFWEKVGQVERERKENFEREIAEWEQLDNFIKAKKKRPVAPALLFQAVTGANVTCVDQLMDREGVFLTIERPSFRNISNAGDAEPELKTICVDWVGVACGHQMKAEIIQGLRAENEYGLKRTRSNDGTHPEVGLLTLGPVGGMEDRYTLGEGIKQVDQLEKIILSYFSRVPTENQIQDRNQNQDQAEESPK